MKRAFLGLATLSIAVAPAFAGHNADSTLWVTDVGALIDSGWVVGFPTGSSDYFNVGHNVVAGIGNTEDVADGLPLTGVAIAVTDFGSGATYPVVGVFLPNLGLDPTGNTPNLASPLVAVNSPAIGPPPLFNYAALDTPEAAIPGGTTKVNSAAQLPPGDSGLLGIGADSTTAHPGVGNSGFTSDGYTTPSLIGTFFDFGINPGQDNSSTTSCKAADRKPHGRLRVSIPQQGIGSGDKLTTSLKGGDSLNLAFFGSKSGDKWRIYFNVAPCTPAIAIGPILPTVADGDGDGSFLRLNATWPAGFGGQTFRFSAVWGNGACAAPGVGFTNCVTIITNPDPSFGICDDGTVESGWVVQIPSGSADYFSNNYGPKPGSVNGLVGLTIGVLDFGAGTPYPSSGVSPSNLGVDGTGNTPDLGSPFATVSPFTFPAGTFATTSGSYISHAISVPGGSLGSGNVHAWVQFPPGDSGLLGVGGDTTNPNGCSYFTLDGFSTPAISFGVNWAIRVATN